MKKYLILIAGSPATGKTYLKNKIIAKIANVLVLNPDEIKEMYADAYGFNNLKEKAKQEKQVWKFYYKILKIYMQVKKRIILSEYPFSDKQYNKLATLCDKYSYEVITIRLHAAFDILWERRRKRDIEQDRHLSHIVSKYHYGDKLVARKNADNLITKAEFYDKICSRNYDNFSLGYLIDINVDNFEKVNYDEIVGKLIQLIK